MRLNSREVGAFLQPRNWLHDSANIVSQKKKFVQKENGRVRNIREKEIHERRASRCAFAPSVNVQRECRLRGV